MLNVSLHCFERGTLAAKSVVACRAGSLGSPWTLVLVIPPFFFLQVPPAPHSGKSCGQQCEWSAQQDAFVAAQQPQKPVTSMWTNISHTHDFYRARRVHTVYTDIMEYSWAGDTQRVQNCIDVPCTVGQHVVPASQL